MHRSEHVDLSWIRHRSLPDQPRQRSLMLQNLRNGHTADPEEGQASLVFG